MTEIERFIMKFGNKKNENGLLIGTMNSEKSCNIGDQEYRGDDLLISAHLKKPLCTKVAVNIEHEDKSKYLPAIKAGDMVLVYPLNNEKIIILDVIEEL